MPHLALLLLMLQLGQATQGSVWQAAPAPGVADSLRDLSQARSAQA